MASGGRNHATLPSKGLVKTRLTLRMNQGMCMGRHASARRADHQPRPGRYILSIVAGDGPRAGWLQSTNRSDGSTFIAEEVSGSVSVGRAPPGRGDTGSIQPGEVWDGRTASNEASNGIR